MVVVFALAVQPAAAIEKTKSAADSSRTRTERPRYTPDKESMERRDNDTDRRDYDDFVDRNNNGIDDRAEQDRENTDESGTDNTNSEKKPGDSGDTSKKKNEGNANP